MVFTNCSPIVHYDILTILLGCGLLVQREAFYLQVRKDKIYTMCIYGKYLDELCKNIFDNYNISYFRI